jgi:molecular chaperone GrpE
MNKKEENNPEMKEPMQPMQPPQMDPAQNINYDFMKENNELPDFRTLEVQKLREDLKKSEGQIEELKEQALRAYAESENIRRRADKELVEARKFAVTSVVKDLTNVIESLYRSTEHVNEEDRKNDKLNKMIEGVELTRNELMAILAKNNVKRVEPKVGDAFDHNVHQALSQVQDNDHPKNAILKVIQAGYLIEDRLIKPALVIVSAGPAS